MANPNWTRDELILALDLYFRAPGARGSKSHPECIRLSDLLNSLPIHGASTHERSFRNANGVGMKLSNFLAYDPSYKGKGLTSGSHLEREVWATFSNDLPRLRRTVDAIVAAGAELSAAHEVVEANAETEDDEAEEGRLLVAVHKRRERKSKLVRKRKSDVLKATGALACEVCSFDFFDTYGELGRGFAECHHDRPVSTLSPGEMTKSSELRIVCANCHRMLHRGRPWLSVAQLRESRQSVRAATE